MEYKGFNIEGDGTFGMMLIKPKGKGSVPLNLRGSYTKSVFAEKAIDQHLSSKGGDKNGKAESSKRV